MKEYKQEAAANKPLQLISASGMYLQPNTTVAVAGLRDADIITAVADLPMIYATFGGFAAMRGNSVLICCYDDVNDQWLQAPHKDVKTLLACKEVFALLKNDGSVLSCPWLYYDKSALPGELTKEHCRGATELVLAGDAAIAILDDSAGLDAQPVIITKKNLPERPLVNVKDVVEVARGRRFAARMRDGSVATDITVDDNSKLQNGVLKIVGIGDAFAAIRKAARL